MTNKSIELTNKTIPGQNEKENFQIAFKIYCPLPSTKETILPNIHSF